jgi:glycosyltransferase involved in cell wall biosynthesis
VTGPIRILYFARAPFISGAERALVTMLEGLDRRLFQPELIVGRKTDLVRIVQSLDVPVRIAALPPRDEKRALAWWWSMARVSRELDHFRPHVVHANDVPSCQAMSIAAGKRGIPRVVHVRWPIKAADMSWWARGGCERVLCVSRWIKDHLGDTAATRLAQATVTSLLDPLTWTARGNTSTGALLSGCAFDRLRLGFVGQLAEVKGIDLIIRALARMSPERRPKLLIAGEDTQARGAYKRRLECLVSELQVSDSIEWLGFLDDVSQLYRQVHAVVCPSRIEPLGLVPLEAAEFSVPALASNTGGFRESIMNGRTGYLVDPTVDDWLKTLEAIEHPQQLAPLGRAAHEHVRTRHSSAAYQEQLTQCYLELANRTL